MKNPIPNIDKALREITVPLPWSFKILCYKNKKGLRRVCVIFRKGGLYRDKDEVADRLEELLPNNTGLFTISDQKNKLFTELVGFNYSFIHYEARENKNDTSF